MTARRALPSCLQGRVHVPFIIVSLRERCLRARSSTRELEFLDPSSRVLDQFEKFCPELGFYRTSTISRALVNWDRLPPIHVCSERGRRLPATCGFVPAACGRRAFVNRGHARGPRPFLRPDTSPPTCRPCALPGEVRSGRAHWRGRSRGGGMRTRLFVGAGCAHWRPRFDGAVRTCRRRPCAQPSRNDPPSAHGPTAPLPAPRTALPERLLQCAQPAVGAGTCGLEKSWRTPTARVPDSRVLASRTPPEQNCRSREAASRAPSTRESAGGDPSSRVLGKWLRFCKTPAQDETFQTGQAHVN